MNPPFDLDAVVDLDRGPIPAAASSDRVRPLSELLAPITALDAGTGANPATRDMTSTRAALDQVVAKVTDLHR